ncbi:MAG: flavodoxin family protein [Oscillospiraceae bacterium]|nr:flavodoxin family protein [Oscillospiraceae bacterium]
MGKKIVILNGSPRKTGNTAALTAAFTKGAREAENVVEEFFLGEMKINGCKGCFGGGKNPKSPCIQKDDTDKIYPKYKTADIVVLASPLYYWTVSGQRKTAFDRLFAVAECDLDYRNPKKETTFADMQNSSKFSVCCCFLLLRVIYFGQFIKRYCHFVIIRIFKRLFVVARNMLRVPYHKP